VFVATTPFSWQTSATKFGDPPRFGRICHEDASPAELFARLLIAERNIAQKKALVLD
jgi:hypothetical protein